MLKNYLQEKKISIYKLAQLSSIPYSTLNDIVNYKVDIANIRGGIIFQLAEALDISMDRLYHLCKQEISVYSEDYKTKGKVLVKNKKYSLCFEYGSKSYMEALYPVKREAAMFIEQIALWKMEEKIAQIEMERAYELCIKA